MSIQKFATLVFAGLVALSSCGESDTILEVQVLGNNIDGIVQMEVGLSIGSTTRPPFKVPEEAQKITLPTSFSVQVSPDLQGPVSFTIKVFGENNRIILEKTFPNVLARLIVGDVNRIPLALTGGVLGTDGGMMMTARDGGMMMMNGDAGSADGAASGGKDGGVASMDAAVVMPDVAVVLPDADLPEPDADVSVDAAEIDAPNGM
jgi:hypothetical protein